MKEQDTLYAGTEPRRRLTPLLITVIYIVVGGLWILTSDSIVSMLTTDPDTITRLQTYKGWFYVAVTALMLYGLVRCFGSKLTAAMQTVKDSEERYRTVVETAMDAVITIDAENRIIFANAAVKTIFGYSGAEVIGRPLSMLMPERFRQRHLVGIQRYRKTGIRRVSWKNVEFPGLDKSGREIPLDISFGEFVKNNQLFFIGIARDITERKQAEDALRKSRRQEAFLADLLERSSQPFAVGYPDGSLIRFNAAFSLLTGYSREELMKADWQRVLTPSEWHAADRATIEALNATGRPVRYEKEFRRKDGSRVAVEVFMHITKDEHQKPRYYYAFISDITDRKRSEAALRESREQFRNMVEATSDWVWELDEHGVYTYASPKVRDILGYRPEEVLGKTPFDFMLPEEAGRAAGILKDRIEKRVPFSLLENINMHKEGRRVVLETSGVPFFDAGGAFRGYRGIDRDITERKNAEETIRYQRHHDLLTGLPNRKLFVELVHRELSEAQRTRKKIAVLFLDVDQFKNINDSLGHRAGDSLIRDMAARLRSSLRPFDTVARVGGDEFTILLPVIADSEEASGIADAVMDGLKKPFTVDHQEMRITASIGLSIYPDDGDNAETLLRNSDVALHYAKDQGRNNYQFFNARLNIRTLERILFENRLRNAVDRGELIVYYQPQQDIRTGAITGAEALVRWRHPELGLLSPMQFIPLAEETGIIIQIDQWVMLAACRHLKAWKAAGRALPLVTVNLSARAFQQPGLAAMVSNILKETGLQPQSIGIEITETLAMQDTELTARNLDMLHAMGVRLLIDDFGTGYSSLSYLKKLPIHKLKIDRSFITYLSDDRDYQAIIRAIIAMAHILKLKVVAEGVETEDQVSFLLSGECDEMQGYRFSQPVPPGEFERLLVGA